MSDDYIQPDFYRFNEDSIHLVKFALKNSLNPKTLLDLCAGSGVVGIEFALQNKNVNYIEFVELQFEFKRYLEQNVMLLNEVEAKIDIISLGEYESSIQFDLILCNPPYYLINEGKISPNLNRAKARSFLIDGWSELVRAIQSSLAPNGKAFVVLKSDEKLKKMVSDTSKEMSVTFVFEEKLMFACFEHKVKLMRP